MDDSVISVPNLENERRISDNLAKLRQTKCYLHKKFTAAQFCTHPTCIQNSSSFLCESCVDDHHHENMTTKYLKTVD